MFTLAIVTCEELPQLTQDDRLLLAPLAQAGVQVELLAWDAVDVDWNAFGAILVRSPWDYFEHIAAFHAWLADLLEGGATVWNPAAVMRSNTDKRYLQQLELGGVRIPLTHWIERGAKVQLDELKRRGGLQRYVIKPTVSAGAAETWISGPETLAGEQQRLEGILERSGAMLQAFLPEVQSEGEWSLMYFNGVFSHAIKKLPKGGDFRVQTEHGGSLHSKQAPAALIEEGEDILRGLGQSLLYARVDGIEVQGEFILLELELIEPELFFRCDPEAPQRFVNALLAKAKQEVPA